MKFAIPRLLSVAVLAAFSSAASAEDAITFQAWGNGAGDAPAIGAGDSLSVSKSLPRSNYAGNPALLHSAWAHAGGTPWYTFQLTAAADVSISLNPTTAGAIFNPGMTVWASGATMFDGGTGVNVEFANNGTAAPHSFNAVGQIGDAGTLWSSGVNGNQLETLAYAVTGASHLSSDAGGTGWDEDILTGFHDVSISNTYENGITGVANAGGNFISMAFNDMQPGWYTVFIGGTNHALSTVSYDLAVNVAAVPEPEAYAMMLAGMGLVGFMARRRRAA